uniref:Uncharacterized protein n=1 Tax=Physcomitrium patens TaxID=3218 RepID=A0A2K1K619_PHYPA|nr:hypothetical protein PHYPA_011126 [Physcomitrium patens]
MSSGLPPSSFRLPLTKSYSQFRHLKPITLEEVTSFHWLNRILFDHSGIDRQCNFSTEKSVQSDEQKESAMRRYGWKF